MADITRFMMLILIVILLSVFVVYTNSMLLFRNYITRPIFKEVWSPITQDFEEKYISSIKTNQNLRIWIFSHLPWKNSDVLLLCGPSATNISQFEKIVVLCKILNTNIVLFDYRGTGKSSAIFNITINTMFHDAHSVLEWILTEYKDLVSIDKIIIAGISLGSLPAIKLAHQYPNIKKLLLINSFSDFSCIASGRNFGLHYTSRVLGDFFPNYTSLLPELKQKIIIISSKFDDITPQLCVDKITDNLLGEENFHYKLINLYGIHGAFILTKKSILTICDFFDLKISTDKSLMQSLIEINSMLPTLFAV